MAEIIGAAEVEANLARELEAMKARADAAMRDVGQRILEDAQGRCPVRTGALQESGRVEVEDGGGTVAVRFGGGSVTYAVEVHEDTSRGHSSGETHFLGNAVEAAQNSAPQEIADKTKVP